MDHDEQTTYVARLHQEFACCDGSGTGQLGRSELFDLCRRLQLEDQANLILEHLLGDDPEAKVDFDEFKEKFVCLLAQCVDSDQLSEDGFVAFSSPEREVSPKVVWGGKKYGRRSRPDTDSLDTDDDVPSDFSEMEAFVSNPSLNLNHDNEEKKSLLVKNSFQHAAKRQKCGRQTDTFISDASCSEASAVDLMSSIFEDKEEDYLHSIWKKLNVGADGFLDQEELTCVCEHIGMEKMSEEVISQLFEKLDVDQDGRISFEEFFHLFKQGDTSLSSGITIVEDAESTLQSVKRDASSVVRKPVHRSLSPADDLQPSSRSSLESYESGIFTSIDKESTGYAEPEAIIELWSTLGISGGFQILKELGFSATSQVCLVDLTAVLEDLLQNSSDTFLYQVALASCQHELHYLRRTLQQITSERDKLRVDIADANMRASLLAQDVDDQQARLEISSKSMIMDMEKKFLDQIRTLQEDLQLERDQANSQVLLLKQKKSKEIGVLREEEARLREKLAVQQSENEQLERENRELEEKLADAHKLGQQQQRELDSLAELKRKLEDIESGREILCEQQVKVLTEELEAMRIENKELRDRNDELTVAMDALKLQLATRANQDLSTKLPIGSDVNADHKEHRRSSSWMSDYIKMPPIKRRGTGSPMNSSTEDNSEEESPRIGKVRRCILTTLSCESSGVKSLGTVIKEKGHHLVNEIETGKPSTTVCPNNHNGKIKLSTTETTCSNHMFVENEDWNAAYDVEVTNTSLLNDLKYFDLDAAHDVSDYLNISKNHVVAPSSNCERTYVHNIEKEIVNGNSDRFKETSLHLISDQTLPGDDIAHLYSMSSLVPKMKLALSSKFSIQLPLVASYRLQSNDRDSPKPFVLNGDTDKLSCSSNFHLSNSPRPNHFNVNDSDFQRKFSGQKSLWRKLWNDLKVSTLDAELSGSYDMFGVAERTHQVGDGNATQLTGHPNQFWLQPWQSEEELIVLDCNSYEGEEGAMEESLEDCLGQQNVWPSSVDKFVMKRLESSEVIRRELESKFQNLEGPLWTGRQQDSRCLIDIEVLNAVNHRLKQQEQRCRQLECVLKNNTRSYEAKLTRIEMDLSNAKDQLRTQAGFLSHLDSVVNDLCWSNSELLKDLEAKDEKMRIEETLNRILRNECQALKNVLFSIRNNTTMQLRTS